MTLDALCTSQNNAINTAASISTSIYIPLWSSATPLI